MPNSAVEFSLADFPGYAEQAARERRIRAAACFGLNETICGFEVKPLCAAHVSYLTLIRSPFLSAFTAEQLCDPVAGRPGLLPDILTFLWIVSPQYKEGSKARKSRWQRKTPRDRFNEAFASLVNLPALDVVKEILSYVEESFIDCGEGEPGAKSFFADEISIALEMAKHGYRLDFWNKSCPAEKNPLLVPLKIVFQLRKARQAMEHGTEGLENKSDKMIAAGLPALGERLRSQKN
jgi:hypothetical protein